MAERPEHDELEELIDSIDGVVWEVDPTTFCFTRVSRGAERLLGFPLASWFSGPHFWPQQIHPEDRQQAIEFCLDSTRALRNHRFEYRMLAADGRIVWVRDIVTVIAADGKPVKLRGIMLDVTQEKNAAAALLEGERRYRALYDDNPSMYFTVDAGGTILSVNRHGAEQLGYRAEELVGAPVSKVIHPEDQARAGSLLARSFEQPQALGHWEFRKVRKDGSVLWVRETLRLVERHPGGLVALIVCEDVTRHRELEAELRQAHKMEAIGRLAGNIAHDFNNLLTVISGYAELLQRAPGSLASPQDPAREIQAAAQRAAALTRQLLAFGKKQVLNPRPLDLSQVVRGLEPMLARLIGTNVTLRFQLEEAGLVLADLPQIEQVVLNLALNARDAMPEGGELLFATRGVELDEDEARHADLPRAGRYVRLEARDTGVGMDEETRLCVFEPFFTTKEGRGTGLGLASVYGIARQSGGGVTVASAPGRGALFSVFLPHLAAPPEAPTARTPEAEQLQGGRGTVLLVEDEPSVRELLATTLRRAGYRVLVAANAVEARELAGQPGALDLLLTDLLMPGEGGRALATRLCAARPGLKVVFISGYPGDGAAAEPAAGGEFTLIPKPFSLAQLTRIVGSSIAAAR